MYTFSIVLIKIFTFSTKSKIVSFIHPYPFLITVYEKRVLQEATGANSKQDIDSIQSKEQFYINLTI